MFLLFGPAHLAQAALALKLCSLGSIGCSVVVQFFLRNTHVSAGSTLSGYTACKFDQIRWSEDTNFIDSLVYVLFFDCHQLVADHFYRTRLRNDTGSFLYFIGLKLKYTKISTTSRLCYINIHISNEGKYIEEIVFIGYEIIQCWYNDPIMRVFSELPTSMSNQHRSTQHLNKDFVETINKFCPAYTNTSGTMLW